jgi:hypothetical protein
MPWLDPLKVSGYNSTRAKVLIARLKNFLSCTTSTSSGQYRYGKEVQHGAESSISGIAFNYRRASMAGFPLGRHPIRLTTAPPIHLERARVVSIADPITRKAETEKIVGSWSSSSACRTELNL